MTENDDVQVALLRNEVSALRGEVATLRQEIVGMVAVWRTANGLLSVIKFLGVVGAGIVAIAAYFKGVVK